jgi:hypothetical protein
MRKLILYKSCWDNFLYAQEKVKTRTFYCEMIGRVNFSGNKIRISSIRKTAFKHQARKKISY